jgi:hypothetical protein
VKSQKRDLNSNIQYLFEVKEMQDHLSQSPIINLHSLACSWLNLDSSNREKFYEKLRGFLQDSRKDSIEHPKDFFFVEQATIQGK